MAGFVKEVTSRKRALEDITERLLFPWGYPVRELPLGEAVGRRSASEIINDRPYPPFSRSLRDGYAVRHLDAAGATPGTPLFLTKTGEVSMGVCPDFEISPSEAAAIPTGGILPKGADAVVMLEDTELAGGWVEVRRGVQAGENIILEGEEIHRGERLLVMGGMVDFKTIGMLATAGVSSISVIDLRISILSTGDEIVPVETKELPPGCIRDVNGWNLKALLSRYGFEAKYRGIANDDGAEFERRFHEELADCDLLILSGGSSVGVRDHCSEMLASLPEPGLLVRGLNIVPGKPTLIAADAAAKKLVVSLPGHPLSCLAVAFTVLLPLLMRRIGAEERECGTRLRLRLARDLAARTGPEEFVPCVLGADGSVAPIAAKSGYISALAKASGFICIPEDRETIRAGEDAEVWLWQ